MSPQYMSEIFHPSHSRYNTRMATLKLDLPFRQSCPGQKTISYLGPNTWNNLAAETKLRKSVNTFKHDIKKLFFDKLKKQNDDIFFYYKIKKNLPLGFLPFPTFFSPCFLLHVFYMFVPVYPSVSLHPPKGP